MEKRQRGKSTNLDEVNLEILTKRTRDLARRSSEETDRRLADFLARGDTSMKLYRVEASAHDYDEYDSFIVWAGSAGEAKQLAVNWSSDNWTPSNFDNDSTVVTELTPPDTAEIVLGSFNAG